MAVRTSHPPSVPQTHPLQLTMQPHLQSITRRGQQWFSTGFDEVLDFVTSAMENFSTPAQTSLSKPNCSPHSCDGWVWHIWPPAEEENIACSKDLFKKQPEVRPTSSLTALHQEKVWRWPEFGPVFKQCLKYVCLPLGSKAQTSLLSYVTTLEKKLYLLFSWKSPFCSLQLSTHGNPGPPLTPSTHSGLQNQYQSLTKVIQKLLVCRLWW